MNFNRSSGILLHITSLPGDYGIGSFGKDAFDFVDFLKKSGQSIWQICPLGPTGYGDSPYQSFSAFAGNPLLIDVEELVVLNLVQKNDLRKLKELPHKFVDFGNVIKEKNTILRAAFENFNENNNFKNFVQENTFWLEDYTLFMSLKNYFKGQSWNLWPAEIKKRNPLILKEMKQKLSAEIAFQTFCQFIFFQQWNSLKTYANKQGIQIFGDMPIFVSFDSADAWANSEIFLFDSKMNPISVAGVPPDYFSSTGQLWGNPLYNWEKLKQTNYSWWKKRFAFALKMYDLIRIDHFRGFSEFWAVPAIEKTAINGSWQPAYGKELFQTIINEFGELPIIAEDLGVITEDVIQLRDYFQFPGMKILQFAFGGNEENPYLPHNIEERSVVYTGTHDNDTTLGWYNSAPKKVKSHTKKYLKTKTADISWSLIETAWKCKSVIAIAPLQDFLSLDSTARFNSPGIAGGNWQWRLNTFLSDKLAKKISDLTSKNGR